MLYGCMKKMAGFGLAGVCLSVPAAGCTRNVAAVPASVQENIVPVRVETVRRSRVGEILRWTGVTTPKSEIALAFKGSGRIRKLFFEEGVFVRKGQILGQLAEEDYDAYVQLARVQVRTLEPDAVRFERLASADAVPGAEAERMRGKVNVARAQLRQAEAALSGVLLKAPADGIIEKKSVSEGDLVSPAREVGKLLDLSQVRVQVAVSEEELALLAPGTPVKLRFFTPAQERTGVVEKISPMADFKTRTFPVSVLVDNELEDGKWKLRAGMRVEVMLERHFENSLIVPFSTVLQDEEGHLRVCRVQDDRANCVPVKTGRLIQGRLEILEGLDDGQMVIVSGQHFLRNKTKIKIIE